MVRAYEWNRLKKMRSTPGMDTKKIDERLEKLESLDGVLKDGRMSYTELQYHGQVTLEDIESVTLLQRPAYYVHQLTVSKKAEGGKHIEYKEFGKNVLKQIGDANKSNPDINIKAYVMKKDITGKLVSKKQETGD